MSVSLDARQSACSPRRIVANGVTLPNSEAPARAGILQAGTENGKFCAIGFRIAELGFPMALVQEGGYVSDALGRNLARLLEGVGETAE